MALPLVWDDKCFVTITRENGTNVEFGAKTRDIAIGGGETGIDVVNVNTGQLVKRNRVGPMTISFSDVPIVDPTVDFIRSYADPTTSTGVSVTSGQSRAKFRVAMLWTDQTGVSTATGSITSNAKRWTIKDAYLTGLTHDWRDQGFFSNVEFTVNEIDQTGGGNVRWELNTTGVTLSALAAFTGGNFG